MPFLDNMWMDLWLNWSGPNSSAAGAQTVLYNGHTAFSGWGLFILDSGQLSVLVGGVEVITANIFVTPGTWQEVRVSRINGVFSLEVDGIEYPLSDQPIPNPLGQCGCQEVVLAGNGSAVFDNPPDAHDGFNGMLDDIRINGVGKPPKAGLLFWHLDEGSGTTATDIHGNILTLIPDPTTGYPAWVPGHGK